VWRREGGPTARRLKCFRLASRSRETRALGARDDRAVSCRVVIESSPRRADSSHNRPWAGLLASGSFSGLLLPTGSSPAVALAAFVPGYSGGTAADLHRFPYFPAESQIPPAPTSACKLSTARGVVKPRAAQVMPDNESKKHKSAHGRSEDAREPRNTRNIRKDAFWSSWNSI